MAAESPTILATSGGLKPGSRTRLEFNKLVHHAVDLSGATGRAPKVAHVGTARATSAGSTTKSARPGAWPGSISPT